MTLLKKFVVNFGFLRIQNIFPSSSSSSSSFLFLFLFLSSQFPFWSLVLVVLFFPGNVFLPLYVCFIQFVFFSFFFYCFPFKVALLPGWVALSLLQLFFFICFIVDFCLFLVFYFSFCSLTLVSHSCFVIQLFVSTFCLFFLIICFVPPLVIMLFLINRRLYTLIILSLYLYLIFIGSFHFRFY